MSAGLTSPADLSNASTSHPELSLGSLASFSATPGRQGFRIPSASSRTTAQSSALLATPPSASAASFGRRKTDDAATSLSSRLNMLSHQEEGIEGDVLDTPAAERNKWGAEAPETPGASARSKRPKGGASGGKGAALTLRDQEKVCVPPIRG
jgi:hypothetical protein